jgi:uncharacterized protein (TIGR00297 family)
MQHETNETLRKSIHIAFGLLAVCLQWLNWRVAAGVCLLAVIANWLILHRIVGKRVSRHERGFDAGIILYPAVVGLLIIVFNWHIEIAAIAWVILAFGDGVATIAGRRVPIAPLPWNRAKSWGGFLSFLAAGSAAAVGIALLYGAPPIIVVLAAVLVSAIVESLPSGIDDNVTVPLAAAATLAVLAITPLVGEVIHPPILWGWIALNTVLAIVGYFVRGVDVSGAIFGWVLGAIIIAASPAMYIALLTFFVIGTACTKLGYRRKAATGLAQERGGRRSAEHAFANAGVAAICAIAVWRGLGLVPLFMGITALATAAADTAGSEIGQLIGRRAFLPTSFRRVERGTEGAISIEGTLAGVLAALAVAFAATAMVVHRIRPGFMGGVEISKTNVITVVTLCAFLGSYIESVAGTYLRDVPNTTMNFFNTAVGAMLFWIAWHFVPMWGFVF